MDDQPGNERPKCLKNIWLWECKTDESFGPEINEYFTVGNGSIFALTVANTWYFFNADTDTKNKWHKPGPRGCTFCEEAVRDGKMYRISEERFEEKTNVWFLRSARDILGIINPWAALLQSLKDNR